MTNNTALHETANGLHVAIIMDGNGRWANAMGRPRFSGHRAGAEVVREILEACPNLGITTLTLYAFSSDNWKRPPREVNGLMQLFQYYIRGETARCLETGVRVSVIGRRDRLPEALQAAVAQFETDTAPGRRVHLRLAVDYSSRDAILAAARRCHEQGEFSREAFGRALSEIYHPKIIVPDVDLLIRTGGEQRLSDFLLWENAYAELYFTKRKWPEFSAQDLEVAVTEFQQRERRFGRVVRGKPLDELTAKAA
ncbi:MAG: di-trans,poly-cis-decaprenylcistransferase [candidate division KSB1 bacterium]